MGWRICEWFLFYLAHPRIRYGTKSYVLGLVGSLPGSILMLDVVLDFLLFRLSVPYQYFSFWSSGAASGFQDSSNHDFWIVIQLPLILFCKKMKCWWWMHGEQGVTTSYPLGRAQRQAALQYCQYGFHNSNELCSENLLFPYCLELNCQKLYCLWLPRWCSDFKKSACQCKRCRRRGFDCWVKKIPWRRWWRPLQYSCLENSMDRGAWQATVHGVKWRFLVDLNSTGLDTGMPLFDLLDKILKPYRSRGSETERTGLQLWLC